VNARNANPPPAMIVLRPGDRVLVTLAEDPGEHACKEIVAELRRSFRGCEFTILSGVTTVAVEPGRSPK
jgi:protein involved in polysaccharide export with SLBB domain